MWSQIRDRGFQIIGTETRKWPWPSNLPFPQWRTTSWNRTMGSLMRDWGFQIIGTETFATIYYIACAVVTPQFLTTAEQRLFKQWAFNEPKLSAPVPRFTR
jgi:hypothetical protein